MFFVGCHWAARAGKAEAKSFTPGRTSRPAHTGHPDPPLVRLVTLACHSGPASQRHQAFRWEPGATWSG